MQNKKGKCDCIMKKQTFTILLFLFLVFFGGSALANTILYVMPEETALHEGTWLQWPHNNLYGPYYIEDVQPTWVSMTSALQSGENVHIIAYDATEQSNIISVLNAAGVPLDNIDFFIHPTDDVWIRDNGPMFVYDQNDDMVILDWAFNGWGGDTPYSLCDVIPHSISLDISLPWIDLSDMVLEGGAIEHDGYGTMMATRSSITHPSRNPSLTESQIEEYLTVYMGITKFIWLDGLYGSEITDMHIDGVMKFANDSTIVTMSNSDLLYWELTQPDIDVLYAATDSENEPYNFVYIPLTQNNVVTTYGANLGYKGSYANYYIANTVVLVPTYNDPNDLVVIDIIQELYPDRTVVGIDVRNLYAYGGMIHCVTQQQPVDLSSSGMTQGVSDFFQLSQNSPNPFSETSSISFSTAEIVSVEVDVYDIMGHIVKDMSPFSASPGEHFVMLSADELGNGVYFYTVKVDGQIMSSRRMMVIK